MQAIGLGKVSKVLQKKNGRENLVFSESPYGAGVCIPRRQAGVMKWVGGKASSVLSGRVQMCCQLVCGGLRDELSKRADL